MINYIILLAILFTVCNTTAQIFEGSIINTAGNSLIPSEGSGGCSAIPQTTGGTIFKCHVSGISSTICLKLALVKINFSHNLVSDLNVYLISPSGQILELSTNNKEISNFSEGSIFCDTASTSIKDQLAPFYVRVRPEGSLSKKECGIITTPNVQSLSDFKVDNGEWKILIFDEKEFNSGQMLSWSLSFEVYTDIVTNNYPEVINNAQGTCNPAKRLDCITKVDRACVDPIDTTIYLYNINYRPNKLKEYTICDGSGIILPGVGIFRIFWMSVTGCVIDTASTVVNVIDKNPPIIFPTCPIGNYINLNLGPGECDIVWEAPHFYALDNCPYTSLKGTEITSTGCLADGKDGLIVSKEINTTLLFDIQNTSSKILALTGIWFMPFTASGNKYRIYSTSSPGSFMSNYADPSAWTLIAGDSTRIGQNTLPPLQPRKLERMGLSSMNFASRITCDATLIIDTTIISPLILLPNEIRGIALCGIDGASFYYIKNDSSCSQNLQGDANLKILIKNGQVQYGSSNMSPFHPDAILSDRIFNGNIDYTLSDNIIPVVQTCGPNLTKGCRFPVGTNQLCYVATDATGNSTTCEFNVVVKPYATPNSALSCVDDVQFSLNNNCSITISADMLLSGGPYKCFQEYLVKAQLWQGGNYIDRDSSMPGIQLDGRDIGHDFKISIIDKSTGNSCWGHGIVVDKTPPTITAFSNDSITVIAEKPFCLGRCEIPIPVVYDNCGSFSLSYYTSGGTINSNQKSSIIVEELSTGINIVYFNALDNSGNNSSKKVLINVLDPPPTINCKNNISISLNNLNANCTNIIRVSASSLDNGSIDNCRGKVWYKAIRTEELLNTKDASHLNNNVNCSGLNGDDNPLASGNQVYFDDYVYFCCSDVGKKIQVELRIFDINPGIGPVNPDRMNISNSELKGKFSECLIDVDVQNNAIPSLIPPPDIVVSCGYSFNMLNITNPYDTTFGRVVIDSNQRNKVSTYDILCHKYCESNLMTKYPGNTSMNNGMSSSTIKSCQFYNSLFDTTQRDKKYNLSWGLDGYTINDYNPLPEISIIDNRKCGLGQLKRVFSIFDQTRNKIIAEQTIWFVDCDPLVNNPIYCNNSKYSDIIWPPGICDHKPINLICGENQDTSILNPTLGKPVIIPKENNCNFLSIEYFDSTLIHIGTQNYKINRHWTVIDWCQYDPLIDSFFGRWDADQVIQMIDTTIPTISINTGKCTRTEYDNVLKLCLGTINLLASGWDIYTPDNQLVWDYEIDLFNDKLGKYNGYDYKVGPASSSEIASGIKLLFDDNPRAIDKGNTTNASGSYPLGVHNICWNVNDQCGNSKRLCKLFEVKDCKNSVTALCLTGVITVPMPSTGCIEIWAKDLDHGSFSTCTPGAELAFFFNGNKGKPNIRICCQDFIDKGAFDELKVDLEMWVEDNSGDSDFCKTTVIVQDNMDICPNISTSSNISKNSLVYIIPNPVKDEFKVMTSLNYYQVLIIDITGKEIAQYNSNSNNLYESTSLQRGVYFVKLLFSDRSYLTFKIVKI